MTAKVHPIKAAPGHVVVIRDEAPDQSKGGIVIPDSGKETVRIGTVVDHCPGEERRKYKMITQYVPGDRVIFGSFCNDDIKLEGTVYTLLHEDEIVATIEEVK